MSLSVDGVWKVGVWAQTVWADGVWSEGATTRTVETGLSFAPLKTKRHRKKLYEQELARKLAIKAIYEEAKTVPETQEAVAKIVRKHSRSEAEIPAIESVDWTAMKKDISATNALMNVWIDYLKNEAEIDAEDDEILGVLFK